ncbi:hypothetical protein GY21_12235 [Cryobacterium roopkundense]|uniref:SAF domain-containing protein n=1 Tax=Cryobacterium roopkundense TaxID=1001240 RepID=A0A099J5Z0_9MICO|nr:hypothetical protein [Cryobacterium roopkundense]KGJ72922.1 hypothetical protein GY21_12235 [Cryobacterium roopkundense]MBB5642085.1 hypothetical protein [Cryobacterium roopkundense]
MKKLAEKSTRTRSWFDPRFAIGIALVVASVVGVAAIVTTADRTSGVYVARSTLVVGDHIDVGDVNLEHVRLGGSEARYVTPARLPREGLLVTRTVQAGELIPLGAVGTRAGESVTSIVVSVRPTLAASVVAGSAVDVWAAKKTGSSQFAPPGVLVPAASVVRIIADTGLMATTDGQSVEILLPKGMVGAVLESVANGDAVSVVAVDAPVAGAK